MQKSQMHKLRWIAAIALSLASQFASATVLTYSAILDGLSEAPPNASPGTGTSIVTIDTGANTMHIHTEFSGLLGLTTASHIHCCTAVPGAGTAGVATTTPNFPGFPLGVTSGIYDHLFDLGLASSWNPAFITAHGGTVAGAESFFLDGLAAGEAYLNIHTSVVPGGEIRGFLRPVPEPATLALAAIGLFGVGWSRRRRS